MVFLYPIAYHNVQFRDKVGRQGKTASKLQKDQGSGHCPEDGKSETDR